MATLPLALCWPVAGPSLARALRPTCPADRAGNTLYFDWRPLLVICVHNGISPKGFGLKFQKQPKFWKPSGNSKALYQ
jgi:hypothetical protein